MLSHPDLLGVYLISDGLLAVAYFSIPFMLFYLVRKRKDLRFRWVFACLGIFLIASGVTHLMEAWAIWHPAYWFEGGIKALAAVASVLTAALALKSIPKALQIPTRSEFQRINLAMESANAEHQEARLKLQRANVTLENRVAERTAELEALNRRLTADNARISAAADAAEAAGFGFWTLDVAKNALQWDELMFQIYGYSPSETQRPYDLWRKSLYPEDRARCEQEAAEALKGRPARDSEFRIVNPSGATRHLRTTARTSTDADGRVARIFGVTFDVTERKRADERFRLAIDAAPTGMLLMNLTGSIVLVNAQIEHLFGYSRADLLGKQIEMLVPERFRIHHPDFRVDFFAAPTVRKMGAGRELYGLRKDGSEVPIEIGLNPLHTSEGDFVLSSIVDLSQRRAIERLRTDFVSTVSHELRTPLTSISGSLGLLQSGAMGPLSEKVESMIRIAYKNSARLVRIINDILDIGKLEAGQLALQIVSISLSELLQQAVEGNSGYAQKYEVRFVLSDASGCERVMADPDRLMQVITNLLSNAAKFSPPGADVLIRVLPGVSTTRVEVQDFGPGIDETFKDRIFEKFAQADASASRRFEGTGLGLSIARKLVEAMGGSIGFTTVMGRGTIFYFELPRTTAPATHRADQLSDTDVHRTLREYPERIGADTAMQRVLYIEEADNDVVTVVRATLAGRADIVLAQGLWHAKQLLNQEHFDLIVLDEAPSERNAIGRTDPIPELVVQGVPIVILSDSESPQQIGSFVGETLVKSQVSAAHVAATILSYLPPPMDFS